MATQAWIKPPRGYRQVLILPPSRENMSILQNGEMLNHCKIEQQRQELLKERVFSNLGVPERIVTDQEPQSKTRLIAELCSP